MAKINYQKKLWKNAPDTSTPLSAANIQIMDDGIKAACDGVDATNDNLTVVFTTAPAAPGNVSITYPAGFGKDNCSAVSVYVKIDNTWWQVHHSSVTIGLGVGIDVSFTDVTGIAGYPIRILLARHNAV